MYPWPIGDFDYKMDAALDIAMDYLEHTTCRGVGNSGGLEMRRPPSDQAGRRRD
jgi:hypothetical protein